MTDVGQKEALAFYYIDGLLYELDSHRDEDTDEIRAFRYSDDLIGFMRSNDIVDPDAAYGLLLDLQEDTHMENESRRFGFAGTLPGFFILFLDAMDGSLDLLTAFAA